MYKRRGQLFVISAPSGAGKTTLCNMLLEEFPNLSYSVSYTTRSPRPHEINGVHYNFVDSDRFAEMVQNGDFLEHATVHSYCYGTSKKAVGDSLEKGCDILLDIDPQGAMQLKELCEWDSTYIFIAPPSLMALRERLEKRNDSWDSLELRMKNARTELVYLPKYDYVLINDVIADAYSLLTCIYRAECSKAKLVQDFNKLIQL